MVFGQPLGLSPFSEEEMYGGPGLLAPATVPPAPPLAAAVKRQRRGIGTNDIIGILADAVLAGTGGQPMYGPQMLRRRNLLEQAQQEENQYQRRQKDEQGQWVARQEYERSHPAPRAPSELERLMGLAGIDPASPEGREYARRAVENRVNPIVPVDEYDQNTGQTIRRFIRPGQNAAPPPPPVGTVRNGYRYNGGNPADRNSWSPVQGGAAGEGQRPFADPLAFHGGIMTSGRRTPEGNALVGGAPNSRHLRGDAADFVPIPGETLTQLLARARAYFPAGQAAIHRGNHVHVSQSGYGRTPYFGRRGTAGLRGR